MMLCIVVGLLYVPAFVYGYFWLWTLMFVFCTTVFLRISLDTAIKTSLQFKDIGKQSWGMSFRLFRLTATHGMVCALPFLFVIGLGMNNMLPEQNFDVSESNFFGFAFSFMWTNLELSYIDLNNQVSQLTLGLVVFMWLSTLSYLIFALRPAIKSRKVIFNVQLEVGDPKITMYGRDDKGELILVLFLIGAFVVSTNEILNGNILMAEVWFALLSSAFLPVYLTTYSITRLFMQARDIKR